MRGNKCTNMRDALIRVAAARKGNRSKEMTTMRLNDVQNATSQVFETTEIIMMYVHDHKNIGSDVQQKWHIKNRSSNSYKST